MRLTAWIVLWFLAVGGAEGEPSLPPLVEGGGKFEDVETLLPEISPPLEFALAATLPSGPLIAFSPGGETLASASEDRTVRLWDVASGREIQRLEGHGDGVRSVDFSLDGETLASASGRRTVRLWDVASGREIQRLEGHGSWVFSVAFSPDGETLASAAHDGTVRLWDVASGREIQRLEGHGSWVLSVAFSPGGETLASAPHDGAVRLWDVASGCEIQRPGRHGDGVRAVAFSPDGENLATASGGAVRLWDVASGREIQRLEGHGDGVLSVAFSPDGETLASASRDHTVRLWNVVSGREIQRLEGHGSWVLSVAFSPDSETLASASYDGTVRLWDVASSHEIQRLDGSGVRSVAFSPDGQILASAFYDGTVRLWDMVSRREIQRLEGHASEVRSMAFSPDGETLASASDDGTVRLWDVASGREIQRLEDHPQDSERRSPPGVLEPGPPDSEVRSVAFSPDGETLASGSTEIRLGRRSEAFRTSQLLLGGKRGTWIACQLDSNTCLRHDDGTLLLQQTEGGRLEPIPPQISPKPPELELLDAPSVLETTDGEATDFTLKIRNAGRHRAFWIRVRQAGQPTGDRFGLKLPTKSILEPGDTAELTGWISAHSDYKDPRPRTATLRLEITGLHGKPLAVPPISVRGKVASLDWQQARWDESGNFLSAELNNTGDHALPAVELVARLNDLPDPLSTVIRTALIPPGAPMSVAFATPDGFEPDRDTRLTLTVRQFSRPGHTWTFRDQPLRWTPPWTLIAALTALLLTLAAGGLFLHPLVRELSARPSGLRVRSPAELPKARRLLALTGRLSSVLTGAGVEPALLDDAVSFLADPDPGTRIRRLAERLGTEPEDAPDPELRPLPLGDSFPLNLDRCLFHLPPADRPAADVLAKLRARAETRDQITVILAPEPARQDQLYRLTGDDLTNLQVAPSGRQLTELLLAPDPAAVLARIIATQVRLTRISPYQTGGGVHRSAVFFGREEFLVHVLNRDPANYLLVGGRQLGKSSLLKAIDRHYREDPRVRCHYLSLAGDDLAGSLAHSLGLARGAGLEQVARRLAKADRRTLVLIDEADAFIRAEGGASPTLARLRGLSEEGRCHFILAGFWDLYAAAVLDYQSPLKNFGETLRIGALEPEACRQLATVPMATMGLSYASSELVERLVRQTGQRANLIAIVCSEILKQLSSVPLRGNLDPRRRIISEGAVDNALESTAIDDALEGWRHLGGGDAEDGGDVDSRLDRILVYATVDRGGFTQAEMLRMLEQTGHRVEPERVLLSLKRLELAYVLGRSGADYGYRVPLFVKRLREQQPAVLLEQELSSL